MTEDGTPKNEFGENLRVKVRMGRKFKEFDALAEANDGGASFKSIATYIENNYKKL